MMMKSVQFLSSLEQQFAELKNPERAQQQQRYMKSTMPYFGLAKPDVARIAKLLAQQHTPTNHTEYCATLLYLFNHAQHREIWYAALDYAMKHKKYIAPESIDTYVEIVRFTAWWDIVDAVATNLIGAALQASPDQETILRSWITDEHLWIRRTALIAQLKYKEKTNIELLAHCIKTTMHEKDFFIRKAIGWALRSYSYTNPEWVLTFIAEHKNNLSSLSVREGLKALTRKQN